MTRIALSLFFFASVLAAQPWRTDWAAFREPLMTCANTSGCASTPTISGPVKWKGTFRGFGNCAILRSSGSGDCLRVEMPTLASFSDQFGSFLTPNSTLSVYPSSASLAAWQALRTGDPVEYRASILAIFGLIGRAGSLSNSVNIAVSNAALGPQPPVLVDVVNGASFVSTIAPRSWITINGIDMSQTTRAWTNADFVNNQLPKALDGVSVKVNGSDAFVYYISPTQINVLAPSDNSSGSVEVAVTMQRGTATVKATLLQISPAFFAFSQENGKYPAAVHLDGTLVGRVGLFGAATASRPPRPGDRILLYGTGFGPTSPILSPETIVTTPAPLANPTLLTVRIGGVAATVEFGGLVGSGLYQINVVIPRVAAGDHLITAQFGDSNTQSNLFLTVAQ